VEEEDSRSLLPLEEKMQPELPKLYQKQLTL
jgi:hypothetical protein